jgi:PAS domain S-box-containing protein
MVQSLPVSYGADHATNMIAYLASGWARIGEDRPLLDASVDGVYIHDLHGAIVECSQSFADMLGYSRDEIRALNVADIDAVKSASDLLASFREEAQIGKALVIETRHRRKDGSVFDVEISVKAVELSGQTYLYTSSRDISERVRMQRLLDEERSRLRDFSNSTADWFWEVDENLKFSFLSENFKGFNGLSAQDLLGMSLPGIYAQDTLNPSEIKAKGLERFRARKPFRDVEVAYWDAQGEVQWFSASGVPVFDNDGDFKGYRGVAAIVTARNRAEIALEGNRRLLQELVDFAPYGIGLFDENRECVVRNEHYGRILRLPQHLLDVKPLRLIDQFRFCYDRGDFADLGLDVPADHAWEIVQARGSVQAERRLGNGRWVETRVVPATGGALVTYFDITSYKEIENELRQTKERLEVAASAGIIGVWECDFVADRFYWDSVMYQIYGLSENDFASPRRLLRLHAPGR